MSAGFVTAVVHCSMWLQVGNVQPCIQPEDWLLIACMLFMQASLMHERLLDALVTLQEPAFMHFNIQQLQQLDWVLVTGILQPCVNKARGIVLYAGSSFPQAIPYQLCPLVNTAA